MSEIRVDTISEKTSGSGTTVSNLKNPNEPFRNLLINGDMQIAQRATSTASITGNGYHTVDRMNSIISSLGTWTQSQSTTVPTGQGFTKSLKMDCTSADASPGASDILRIQQAIEGQNLQHLKYGTSSAESTTLSFWVRSNKTGTYVIQLLNGAVSRQVGKTYTISSADTWEKKTITFPGDTSTALDNDNTAELYVQFCLGTGTDRSSGTLSSTWKSYAAADQFAGQTVNLADSTSNEWYITGIQLEVGTGASDFEHLPFDVQLNRCFRYYLDYANTDADIINPGTGIYLCNCFYYQADNVLGFLNFPVPMREEPTLTTADASNAFYAYHNNQGDGLNSLSANAQSTRVGVMLQNSDGDASGTIGHAGAFYLNSPNAFNLSAEI